MAASKRQRAKLESAAAPLEARPGWSIWQIAAALLGSLILVFEIYGPALSGPFLLDDG